MYLCCLCPCDCFAVSSSAVFVLGGPIFRIFHRRWLCISCCTSRSFSVFSCSVGGVAMIVISGCIFGGVTPSGCSCNLSRRCPREVLCYRCVFPRLISVDSWISCPGFRPIVFGEFLLYFPAGIVLFPLSIALLGDWRYFIFVTVHWMCCLFVSFCFCCCCPCISVVFVLVLAHDASFPEAGFFLFLRCWRCQMLWNVGSFRGGFWYR